MNNVHFVVYEHVVVLTQLNTQNMNKIQIEFSVLCFCKETFLELDLCTYKTFHTCIFFNFVTSIILCVPLNRPSLLFGDLSS